LVNLDIIERGNNRTLDSADRQLPPPNPAEADAVPYFSTPPAAGLVAVATFSSIGRWHAANAVLARNGITAVMGDTTPDGDTLMLIPRTELEWARELLNITSAPPPPLLAATADQTPRSPLPVDQRLQPRSDVGYLIVMVLLVLAMVFIVLIMAMAVIFWN
jgi:hypothetical protein